MDCKEFKSKIGEHLDGDLGDMECDEFIAHAKCCKSCRDRLQRDAKLLNSIKELCYDACVPEFLTHQKHDK